jgi:hypothetical protein
MLPNVVLRAHVFLLNHYRFPIRNVYCTVNLVQQCLTWPLALDSCILFKRYQTLQVEFRAEDNHRRPCLLSVLAPSILSIRVFDRRARGLIRADKGRVGCNACSTVVNAEPVQCSIGGERLFKSLVLQKTTRALKGKCVAEHASCIIWPVDDAVESAIPLQWRKVGLSFWPVPKRLWDCGRIIANDVVALVIRVKVVSSAVANPEDVPVVTVGRIGYASLLSKNVATATSQLD